MASHKNERKSNTQTNQKHAGQMPIFTSLSFPIRYVTIKLARSFHIAANNAKGIALGPVLTR
jgi:hypothetical protein